MAHGKFQSGAVGRPQLLPPVSQASPVLPPVAPVVPSTCLFLQHTRPCGLLGRGRARRRSRCSWGPAVRTHRSPCRRVQLRGSLLPSVVTCLVPAWAWRADTWNGPHAAGCHFPVGGACIPPARSHSSIPQNWALSHRKAESKQRNHRRKAGAASAVAAAAGAAGGLANSPAFGVWFKEVGQTTVLLRAGPGARAPLLPAACSPGWRRPGWALPGRWHRCAASVRPEARSAW